MCVVGIQVFSVTTPGTVSKALQDRYTQLSADADGWTAEKHGNTRGSLGQQSRDKTPQILRPHGTLEVPRTSKGPGASAMAQDLADESDDSCHGTSLA